MIIFLYGPDSYRRIRKVRELTDAFRLKHPQANLETFDFEDDPEAFLKLKAFASQDSFFDTARFAIIKNISDCKQDKELSDWLKNQIEPPNPAILVCDAAEPQGGFEFLASPEVKRQAFGELEGGKLAFFIRQEAARRNLVFTISAEKQFTDRLGHFKGAGLAWFAVNELDKLQLSGAENPVTSEAFTDAVLKPEEDVGELAYIIGREKDLGRRLAALERLFLRSGEPAHLFNVLAYRVYGRALVRLADYDISIKSGGLDYEEALLDLILP